ncbi:MAG: hypothetical protein K1X94_22650 [Sandaracinaceae bacterium]|jgi:hypothetical protein|nr:hypothetical protein [Sandaracinaceae bacterium]
MPVLFESDHVRLEHEPSRGLVRFTRTPARFESLDEADRVFGALAVLDVGIPRSELVLLIDARRGPGRNDDPFEKLMDQHRPRLFRGFRKRAILVQTVVGKLQATRINRESGFGNEIFDDEAAALAYLASP